MNNDCPADNYGTGYYVRLLQDTTFQNELRCDYEYYRTNVLDTTIIFANIEFNRTLLQNAQQRHFQRWQILGVSGPAPEIGAMPATFNAELDTLKAWIGKRIQWLDENIPGHCINAGVNEMSEGRVNSITGFPNPANQNYHLNLPVSKSTLLIEVYNEVGAKVHSEKIPNGLLGAYGYELNTADYSNGVYLVKCEFGNEIHINRFVVQH